MCYKAKQFYHYRNKKNCNVWFNVTAPTLQNQKGQDFACNCGRYLSVVKFSDKLYKSRYSCRSCARIFWPESLERDTCVFFGEKSNLFCGAYSLYSIPRH